MIKIMVSACLIGESVRYDGRSSPSDSAVLKKWGSEGRVVSFCPEVAAGLPVPRAPSQIRGADGARILAGEGGVFSVEGGNMTSHFVAGAKMALLAARENGVRLAVLKDRSPSCGSSSIYDGSFTGNRKAGQGVTTALLRGARIQIFNELELEAAESYLAMLLNH